MRKKQASKQRQVETIGKSQNQVGKNNKENDSINYKGITLITLVVTIIVLLLLAGVTINLTIGHNGIFSRAKEAKTSYEREALLEEMRLAMLDKKLEKGADLTNEDVADALGKFGEVQKNDDGTVTGVKPNGGDEVITFDEIENGETASGGAEGEGGGSTGPESGITSAELAALRGEVTDLANATEANSASIASLEAQIKSLQESLAASGDTNEKVASLQSQLDALKSQVESQKSSSESRLSSIETRLAKAEQATSTSALLDKIYPVGSILISSTLTNATEVQRKFGGTWKQLSAGQGLVSSGNGYTLKSTRWSQYSDSKYK